MITIELYYKKGVYGAYISEDGSSGYDCKGSTPEECGEQVARYIADAFYSEDFYSGE